jgi:ankyrin repeat protein
MNREFGLGGVVKRMLHSKFFIALEDRNHALALRMINELPKSIKVNEKDTHGVSVLIMTIKLGYYDIFKQLLDLGADPRSVDNEGFSAFYYALLSFQKNRKFAEELIRRGVMLENARDKNGNPFIFTAIQRNFGIDIFEFLFKHGADANVGFKISEELLAINPGIAYAVDKPPLYFVLSPEYRSEVPNHLEIVKLFLDNGAKINEDIYDYLEELGDIDMLHFFANYRRRHAMTAFIPPTPLPRANTTRRTMRNRAIEMGAANTRRGGRRSRHH